MERMIRYSLERNRPIRLMFTADDGSLRQVKAVVEKRDGPHLQLYILRPPQRLTIHLDQILSADYMAGDDGM